MDAEVSVGPENSVKYNFTLLPFMYTHRYLRYKKIQSKTLSTTDFGLFFPLQTGKKWKLFKWL